MTKHKWHKKKCLLCGIERNTEFDRSVLTTIRAKWRYTNPTGDGWTYERPECKERPLEDIRGIIQKVNDYFGVNIYVRTRRKPVCLARHIAVELLWNFGGMDMNAIALILGIDRTTGINSRKVVWDLCATDPAFRRNVIELETMLES